MRLELLLNFLIGALGSENDASIAATISRLVVVGNLFAEQAAVRCTLKNVYLHV
jgi:hypothetical protein